MLGLINQKLIDWSHSWRVYLLVVLGQAITLSALLNISQQMADINGFQAFDMQNELTVQQIFAQLPQYTDESFRLYYLFTAIDYVFPVVAGLVLAIASVFFMRYSFPALHARLAELKLYPLLLLGTLFDFMENIFLLSTMLAFPNEAEGIATMAIVFKKCKLTMITVSGGLTLVLAIISLFSLIRRRLSR
ncbi:MAG: hypothetical protein ACR2P6_08595 [Gammaproteobacteria bacterium]